MAKLLHEIEWEPPVFGSRSGSAVEYEAELASKLSPWLVWATMSFSEPVKFSYATATLMGVAYFVTSQENACRHCYGTARAVMKIWGYSEKQVRDLEQEASLADGTTRRVVEFSRKLAKSNPSPAKRDSDALVAGGLSREAVCEIAACVGEACFANRIATFVALPPNLAVEKLPASFLGRILSPFYRRKLTPRKAPPPEGFRNEGPCAPIIAAAGHTLLAAWLRRVTDGCMSSQVISPRSKALMLAVVARQLGSQLCERETRESLVAKGLSESQVQDILDTLSSSSLTPEENRLLRWTRETVWYEPRIIQNSTRRLADDLGEEVALEAVGSAALFNALARLSLVRQ
jgi:alkylhydroperoxidase family enzyme